MIPYAREAGAVLLLALLSYAGVKLYHFGYTSGHNTANVRAEKIIGDFAKAEAVAQAKARETEQERVAAVANASEQYERGKQDAQAKADAVVADLRAGTVRLRQHWQGAIATCGLSRDSAAVFAAEREAELREQGAADIVRLAAEADAQVSAIQAAYEAMRRESQ